MAAMIPWLTCDSWGLTLKLVSPPPAFCAGVSLSATQGAGPGSGASSFKGFGDSGLLGGFRNPGTGTGLGSGTENSSVVCALRDPRFSRASSRGPSVKGFAADDSESPEEVGGVRGRCGVAGTS